MIKKLKQFFETQTSLLKKKVSIFKEKDIECSVDEQVVDCKELDDDPYVGVPAPILNPVMNGFLLHMDVLLLLLKSNKIIWHMKLK